jgi:rare lipoprotein A
MKAFRFGIASAASLVAAPVCAETCKASFYGRESGRYTATGERFNPMGLTAASLSYPFGSMLKVSLQKRAIIVRVNDRGPARKTGKCLDLSQGAAAALRLPGIGMVHIRRLG